MFAPVSAPGPQDAGGACFSAPGALSDQTFPSDRSECAQTQKNSAKCPESDFSRIGIIGFGAFGRLIARHAPAGVRLLAYDVKAPVAGGYPGDLGHASLVSLAEAASCPVVVLAAPVAATAQICRQITPWLQPGALVVDVGSVKSQPVSDMIANLPAHVEIAGLHPLFGPQSAADGLERRRIVACPVRGRRVFRLMALLRAALGLEIQFATPEAHDREMAMVQGITHMVGRLVASLDARPTRMTTGSYALLMQAVEMVRHDNPAVFDAIALRNPFVAEVQEQFFGAAARMQTALAAQRQGLGRDAVQV